MTKEKRLGRVDEGRKIIGSKKGKADRGRRKQERKNEKQIKKD